MKYKPMSLEELVDTIAQLGGSKSKVVNQGRVAQMIRGTPRTLRNYLNGTYAIPVPTIMLLRILVAVESPGRELWIKIGYGGGKR